MEKRRKVVNARKFVSDVRSGMSAEELMAEHGLDRKGLEKLWILLVQKGLLETGERPPAKLPPRPPQREESQPKHPPAKPSPLPHEEGADPDGKSVGACPQCGAPVGKRALICPECGHVLPGQERWESVGPRKTLAERIPPWLLGLVISAPFAVVIFVMFQHFFVPAAERRIERQQPPVNKPAPPSDEISGPSQPIAKDTRPLTLQEFAQRLIAKEIILAHSVDYRTFTSGDRWNTLTIKEKEDALRGLQSKLKEEKLTEEFLVIDAGGGLRARAVVGSVEILDEAPAEDQAPLRDNPKGE
jgi:hypothetical protein